MTNIHSLEARCVAALPRRSSSSTHSPALIAAAALFIASGLPGIAAAPAIPPAEKLLPDDTLVVVSAPDFVKVRELYKTSPQAQFWNDPAMKAFKDNFMGKWNEEFIKPLERELGVKFDDYENLPQGQVTFAVTQNGWDGDSSATPAFLLLLDTKDKSDQLKKNLSDLRKKWVESGKTIKTEKVRDVEFSVVPLSEEDLPEALQRFLAKDEGFESETNKTSKNDLIIGQFQSLLIVANSVKPVEKVLVHATGGAMPALADLAAFDANRLSLFRDSPFYAWVNMKAFMDVFNKKPASRDESEASPFSPSNPEKILTATGLSGVKTLALGFQNSSEGSLFHFFVGVPESVRQGIFKLFPAEGKTPARRRSFRPTP